MLSVWLSSNILYDKASAKKVLVFVPNAKAVFCLFHVFKIDLISHIITMRYWGRLQAWPATHWNHPQHLGDPCDRPGSLASGCEGRGSQGWDEGQGRGDYQEGDEKETSKIRSRGHQLHLFQLQQRLPLKNRAFEPLKSPPTLMRWPSPLRDEDAIIEY